MIKGQRYYYKAFLETLQIFKNRLLSYDDPGAEMVSNRAALLEQAIKIELEVSETYECNK